MRVNLLSFIEAERIQKIAKVKIDKNEKSENGIALNQRSENLRTTINLNIEKIFKGESCIKGLFPDDTKK